RAIFEPHQLRTERIPGETDVKKDGLARVCDLNPGVPTYLLERGDEKRPKKAEVIKPGVPESLGGALKIKPIDLPLEAYYPALQEFALQEDQSQVAQHRSHAHTS